MKAPDNNEMQLTSGGSERASRAASLMRRLQLIPADLRTSMGFEAWVQWFEKGAAAAVPASEVQAIFAKAIVSQDGPWWQLSHDGRRCCEVHVKVEPLGRVSSVALLRPCTSREVWESAHALLTLGHGVCYWPAGPPVVAAKETVPHLPTDMTNSLGEPQVALDGAAIADMIAQP